MLETECVVLLDELTNAGQYGDAYGWREAIRVLEANWLAPLLGSLRALGPARTAPGRSGQRQDAASATNGLLENLRRPRG